MYAAVASPYQPLDIQGGLEVQLYMQYKTEVHYTSTFDGYLDIKTSYYILLTSLFVTVVTTVIRSITLKVVRNAQTIGAGKL